MNKKQKLQEESKPRRGAIDLYAAQCCKCEKWRSIDTKEEYEELRSKFANEPFSCGRKPNVTCDDPADLECDATRTWVIDKPNLPKTPQGFKRELILRSDYSKLDAHYLTPTGKKVRCHGEVVQFLEKNPEYKHLKLDDFNFTVPKILEDTIPEEVRKKRAEKSASKKEDSDVKKKITHKTKDRATA
ncbi:Methyl-CpG-binding domain-containing protein 4, partial [Bienertia sinuspersici]